MKLYISKGVMKLVFEDETKEVLWREAVWGLALVDNQGRFVKVNPRLCAILEYTESELLSKTFQDITHPEDLYDDVHMAKSVETGDMESYIMTKRYITKRNDVIWCKLQVNSVRRDSSDEFMHFLSQISPAITVRNGKDPYDKQKELPETKKARGVWEFCKDNPKTVISIVLALIAGIGTVINEYISYMDMKNQFNRMLEQQTESEE